MQQGVNNFFYFFLINTVLLSSRQENKDLCLLYLISWRNKTLGSTNLVSVLQTSSFLPNDKVKNPVTMTNIVILMIRGIILNWLKIRCCIWDYYYTSIFGLSCNSLIDILLTHIIKWTNLYILSINESFSKVNNLQPDRKYKIIINVWVWYSIL